MPFSRKFYLVLVSAQRNPFWLIALPRALACSEAERRCPRKPLRC